MNRTIFDEGMEEGWRRAVLIILERRLGPINESARQWLAEYPADKLPGLVELTLSANSLKELGFDD